MTKGTEVPIIVRSFPDHILEKDITQTCTGLVFNVLVSLCTFVSEFHNICMYIRDITNFGEIFGIPPRHGQCCISNGNHFFRSFGIKNITHQQQFLK